MSARVVGAAAALALIDGLPDRLRRAIEAEAPAIVRPLRQHLAVYPPELPNQHYERTYNLRDGWLDSPVQSQFVAGGIALTLRNPVEYVGDVQEEPQDPYFVGRWETTYAITQAETPQVVDIVRRVVDSTVGEH